VQAAAYQRLATYRAKYLVALRASHAGILASQQPPRAATASIASPEELERKLQDAIRACPGFVTTRAVVEELESKKRKRVKQLEEA